MLIFSKYKYLHVKIASLANVKSCITVGPISLMANVWPCIVPVDYLSYPFKIKAAELVLLILMKAGFTTGTMKNCVFSGLNSQRNKVET